MKKTFFVLLLSIILGWGAYSQDIVTIGEETPSVESQYVPIYTYYNYSLSQTVYLESEIGKTGLISSLSWYLSSHSSESMGKSIPIKVYMALSEQTTVTSSNYIPVENSTLVYEGNLDLGTDVGWKTILLDSPFELTDANLVITVEAAMGIYFMSPYWGAYSTSLQSGCSYYDYYAPTTISSAVTSSPAIKLAITEQTGQFCYSVKKLQDSVLNEEFAKVWWSSVDESNGYQYQIKLSSEQWEDSTDSDINNTNDTIIEFTDLTANTLYDVRVRNVCSDTNYSAWKKISFKTDCVFLTEDDIPYVMNPKNEESGQGKLPSCWTRLNTTNTTYPYLHSSGYLYMYYNNAVALNGYTGDITELQLSFLVAPGGTSSSYGTVEIGIMTDLTDNNTYTTIKSFAATELSSSTWTKVEVPFDTYTLSDEVETYYVVIKHIEASTWAYSWYLKDITLEHITSCKFATKLKLDALSSESATLSWTAGDETTSWSIYYWKYSEDGNTDTLSIENISDTLVELTNLEAQTGYYFYLVTNCGEYSPKTMSYYFKTACNAVEVTDDSAFVADFSSDVDLDCWDMGDWYQDYDYLYTYYSDDELLLPTLNIENVTTPYLKIKHDNAETELKISYRTSTNDQWVELCTLETINDTLTDIIALPNASSTYQIKITNIGDEVAHIYSIEVYNEENPPSCLKAINLQVNATSSSATFTWSQPDDASSWVLYYKTEADNSYTASEDLTDTTYTIEVEPQTKYFVYVATACGDDENNYPTTAVLTFTTPCIGLIENDLPKTWNFDSNNVATSTDPYDTYPLPECWQKLGNDYSVYVFGSQYYTNSGDSCLMIAASNNYAILPYIDPTSIAINTLQVSLYARTMYNGYDALLTIGVITNPSDKSTFSAIDSVNLTGSYMLYEFPLSSYQGQNGYIAIRITGSYYVDVLIDDVVLAKAPDCLKPKSLTATNLTTSSATITWTQGGTTSSWKLYYKEADDDNYTEVTDLTETFYNLTVSAGKTYNVYVTAVCDTTTLSTDAITFKSPCFPMTASDLPYTIDFEDETAGDIPMCWADAPAYKTTSTKYPRIANSSYYAFDGNQYLYMYNTCGVALKGYQGDISALQLSLQAKPGYNSSLYGTLEIGVQTDLFDATTYQSVKVYNAADYGDSEYDKLVIKFDSIIADSTLTYYVIIRHNGTYSWYVDNVKLEFIPSCAEATNVTVSNITGTTATVSWTQPDEADSWTIYYKTADEQEYQSVEVSDTTYILTELTPQTNYSVYVKTMCSGFQPTTTKVNFRTNCADDGITITEDNMYVEDFETDELNFPDCWLALNTSPSYPTTINTYSVKSGTYSLPIKASGDANQPIVILPKFTNDITTLKVLFYSLSENSQLSGSLEFGYITDITNVSTFVALTSYPNTETTWTKHSVSINNYAEQLAEVENARLAFRHNDSSYTANSWYYYAIDSVVVKLAPNCQEAYDLVVTQQATSASITWSSDAPSFNISVKDENNTEVATESDYTTTQYDLSDLTPNTTYTISITSVCSDNSLTDVATKTFTTPCLSITEQDLPYKMNFDSETAGSYSIPSCWTKLLGKYSYPYIYNTEYSYSPSNCLIMSYNNTLAMQPYEGDISALQLSMYLQPEDNTVLYGSIEVGIQTDLEDSTTYTKIGETFATEWSTYDWENKEFAFNTYQTSSTTNTYYVVIKHIEPYNTGYDWLVDNITLEKIPACKKATNVNVSNITTESATISWIQSDTSVSSWIVNYRTVGATQWDTIQTDSTSVTLTNLQESTTYEARIEGVCDLGDNPLSATITFKTSCSSILVTNTTPWEASFSSEDDVSCWTLASSWTLYGGKLYHSYSSSQTTDDAITPIFDLSAVTAPAVTLTYTLKDYMSSNIVNTLTVLYRADSTDTWTELKSYNTLVTDAVDTIALPNKSATYQLNLRWSDYDIDADGIEISALKVFNNSTDTTTPSNPCAAPTSLTASNIAQTTATVSWVGTASSYDVQLNNNTVENVTTTSKQFSDLTANTTYTVKVRSNCGTTTSDWVTTTFTTLEDTPAPCNAPTNLEVIPTSNSLTLSWTGDAAAYDVQINDETVQTTQQTIFTFANLTPSTTYSLKVRSNCGNEVSDWATITGTTNPESTGDEDPVVTTNNATVGETTATLNAVINTNGNTITKSGFKYRELGANEWTNDVEATLQSSGLMSIEIDGLTPNTDYEYKAYVITSEGNTFEGSVKAFKTLPSGLTDVENSVNILTYPNPTTTNATLEINGLTEDANIILTDVNGRVVFKDIYSVNQSSITISTGSLSAGVYYIRVTNANFTKTQTLIKK